MTTPPSDLHPIRPSPIIEGQLLRRYRRAVVRAVQSAEQACDVSAILELTNLRHVADEAIELWRGGQW